MIYIEQDDYSIKSSDRFNHTFYGKPFDTKDSVHSDLLDKYETLKTKYQIHQDFKGCNILSILMKFIRVLRIVWEYKLKA